MNSLLFDYVKNDIGYRLLIENGRVIPRQIAIRGETAIVDSPVIAEAICMSS